MAKVKLLFLFFIFSYSTKPANLEIRWFGTSTISITDGNTTLLLDPFFTRPGFLDLLSFSPLKTNTKVLKESLNLIGGAKVSAIFVSHTHYDHVLDLVEALKLTQATLYGSKSALNVVISQIPDKQIKQVAIKDQLQIGAFKITILPGNHPPHFFGHTLLEGEIKKPLGNNTYFFDYKMGQAFNFLIEHPSGNIIFHPSSRYVDLGIDEKYADLAIMGIARRRSTKEITETILKPLKVKTVIPVHWDNFFKPLKEGPTPYPGVDIEEFKKSAIKYRPTFLNFLQPYLLQGAKAESFFGK